MMTKKDYHAKYWEEESSFGTYTKSIYKKIQHMKDIEQKYKFVISWKSWREKKEIKEQENEWEWVSDGHESNDRGIHTVFSCMIKIKRLRYAKSEITTNQQMNE